MIQNQIMLVGETDWEDTIKCATIRIISKEEHGNDRIQEYDFEQILVHELLHIKFGLLSFTQQDYNGKVTAELRHQLIDDLARALVMAKRGETKRKLAKNCKKVKDITEKEEVILENLENALTNLKLTTKEIADAIIKQSKEACKPFITERS